MGKIFDLDSGFFKISTRIGDFMILNLLVIIFSIPLITIGPALAAGYYVGLKEVRDEEGAVVKSFWKAFKDNFRQGAIIEIILVIAAVILYFDVSWSYEYAYTQDSFVFRLVFFALTGMGLVLFAIYIYVFPMLARFENTVKGLLKNALLISVKHLPQTIIILIINGILIYTTSIYPLFILLSVGITLYSNSYIMVRIFKIYTPKTKHDEDPDQFVIEDSEQEDH